MDRKSIMVVDDHSITRRSLMALLTSAFPEFGIDEARNGLEAIDRTAANPPEAIVMDLVMPRMDGARATREIKVQWPEIKVIILILDGDQGQKALEAGADAYLPKDDSSADLLDVLGSLGIHSSESEDLNE